LLLPPAGGRAVIGKELYLSPRGSSSDTCRRSLKSSGCPSPRTTCCGARSARPARRLNDEGRARESREGGGLPPTGMVCARPNLSRHAAVRMSVFRRESAQSAVRALQPDLAGDLAKGARPASAFTAPRRLPSKARMNRVQPAVAAQSIVSTVGLEADRPRGEVADSGYAALAPAPGVAWVSWADSGP